MSDMNLEKITAISNTGPLVSVFQCGKTDVLKKYFSIIYITPSEVNELKKHGWSNEINNLINEGFIIIVEPLSDEEKIESEIVAKKIAENSNVSDWKSHIPEAEAIVIMKYRIELEIEIILIDEKAGRVIAEEMGLNITGFPGILGWAGKDRILRKNEIRDLLKICQKQGTHYSNKLIELISGFGGEDYENGSRT